MGLESETRGTVNRSHWPLRAPLTQRDLDYGLGRRGSVCRKLNPKILQLPSQETNLDSRHPRRKIKRLSPTAVKEEVPDRLGLPTPFRRSFVPQRHLEEERRGRTPGIVHPARFFRSCTHQSCIVEASGLRSRVKEGRKKKQAALQGYELPVRGR